MDNNTNVEKTCQHCGSFLNEVYNNRRYDVTSTNRLLVCLTCDKDYWETRMKNSDGGVNAGINQSGFNFVENLEIFPEEIFKVTWYEVFEINLNLKDNWKIPTMKQLGLLYKSRVINHIFKSRYYWSIDDGNDNHAWAMSINNGFKPLMNKNKKFSALIIREMQNGSKEN